LFVHGHPANADSWKLGEVRKLQREKEVVTVMMDKCMYGLTTRSSTMKGKAPAKSTTKWITNSRIISGELQKRCDRSHAHQRLLDGRAQHAQLFPEELCRAISRGLVKERRNRVMNISRVTEVSLRKCMKHIPDADEHHDKDEADSISRMIAWDDLTGMTLQADKVVEARAKELEYVKRKRVWVKVPRALAVSKGWKIIKTRWIDINKGDDEVPVYRSRVVGKEFNDGAMEGLFAGTPPLEALRYLVHEAATVDDCSGEDSKVMMLNDVARAFL